MVNVGAGGAIVSTRHVLVAGSPRLPAASVARTPKVWLTWARLEYEAGLVQPTYAAPSSEQLYRRLPSGPEKEKEADAELETAAGADVIVGWPGAVLSTV